MAGDRVYVGVANDDVFSPTGTLYCLDRNKGEEVWHFDNKRTMRQIHSTPCLSDGKVYIGEGLHEDSGCKVYCLDANTGSLVWSCDTESHTESSPVVADGKVYCGAGDDGLYCLDAATGKKLWNFPGYHIDTRPAVVGNRVFAGAGVGDIYKEPAIVCLNAETGAKEWLVKTDLPVWGSPTVAGDLVYFGLGNSRIGETASQPEGALLCVRAADGSEVFRSKTGDSVLTNPAVDAYHVYFGSSDGKLYCVGRQTGKPCWQSEMSGEAVASPVLLPSRHSEAPWRVLALGLTGQMKSLDPATGDLAWVRSLIAIETPEVKLYATAAIETPAEESEARRIYVAVTIDGAARVAELRCYELVAKAEK